MHTLKFHIIFNFLPNNRKMSSIEFKAPRNANAGAIRDYYEGLLNTAKYVGINIKISRFKHKM